MQILVIGGNRYFGKRLVFSLARAGHKVYVMNRGSRLEDFPDTVEKILCDRKNELAFLSSLEGLTFDVVIDNICLDAKDAEIACRVLKGRTKRLVYTSSQSVYKYDANLTESAFDAKNFQFTEKIRSEKSYAEAKRQAEATYLQQASFPVVALRFPLVMGIDDYTERLKFHVDAIASGRAIYFPNLNAKISMISSEDAAEALEFVSQIQETGSVNVAAPEPICLADLIHSIEEKLQKKLILAEKGQGSPSPFGVEKDWYMNTSLWQSWGGRTQKISDWMPPLLHFYSSSY